ncbi:MAG: paraquat-inducible protein A [Pseudomonadota bacterium]
MSRKLRMLGFLSVFGSLALLYPGVTQPVLTLSGELEKSALAEFGIDVLAGEGNGQSRDMLTMMSRFLGLDQLEGRIQAYKSTRSILGMAQELAESNNVFVAVLIVTFSMVIPSIKLLMQLTALLGPSVWGRRILIVNSVLGKWSMADVFVMAMLVAFMAGSASNHMGELLLMNAQLEPGFWYFLAYCLFAILAGSILQVLAGREEALTDRSASLAGVQSAQDE